MPTDNTLRLEDFQPLFQACKNDKERDLLRVTIREGKTFQDLTSGFEPPYSITDLIMVDIAKTMRLPRTAA